MTQFLIWHSESFILIMQLLFKNIATGSIFIGFYMLAKYPKTKLFFHNKLITLNIIAILSFFSLVFFDPHQVFFDVNMTLILQQQNLINIGAYALIFYSLFNVMLVIAFKKNCEHCPKLRFSGLIIALVASTFSAIFSPYYQDYSNNIFIFVLPFIVELCHALSLAGIYFIIASDKWLNKKERLQIASITFVSSFIIALYFIQQNVPLLIEFDNTAKILTIFLAPLIFAALFILIYYKSNSNKFLSFLALMVFISLIVLRSFEFYNLN